MEINFKELSELQKRSPCAKYVYRAPAQPNPVLMDILSKGPMDSSKALPVERINSLLEPGYHEIETGYCVMDNGVGYVAVNNVFPKCSVDMMKWWFAWHCLEGIRYKIWCPEKHGSIAVSDLDRSKILDTNVPIEEKYTDVGHYVIEDIGAGFDDIVISFKKPGDMGFDVEKLKSSPVKALFGGSGIVESRIRRGNKVPAVMVHTCREIKGGVEFRTRFYLGCRINKGVPMCVLPRGVKVPIEAPMGLAFHNVEEYSNLAAILPEVYQEFGPDIR
jgi:hypothetical protein